MARLQERYKSEIAGQLAEELSIKNPMCIPRLTKIVVSMGTGSPINDKNRLPAAIEAMSTITGQKPQIRRAARSVSNFKLRRGMDIGCRVTLRGRRMYEFFDRLVSVAIPRLRDFRGLSPKSFDGRGNYSLGLPDQLCFPEVDPGKVSINQGMNVTLVTTASKDSDAQALLLKLGLPLTTVDNQ